MRFYRKTTWIYKNHKWYLVKDPSKLNIRKRKEIFPKHLLIFYSKPWGGNDDTSAAQ